MYLWVVCNEDKCCVVTQRAADIRVALKPNLNPRLKLWKGLGSPVIDETDKKGSLLVYLLNFFGILAGRCGSVVIRERN